MLRIFTAVLIAFMASYSPAQVTEMPTGGLQEPEDISNPMLKSPFSEMVGLWRPEDQPVKSTSRPGGSREIRFRWAKLGFDGKSMCVDDIVRVTNTDGSQEYHYHDRAARYKWMEDAKAIGSHYPMMNDLAPTNTETSVENNGAFVTEFGIPRGWSIRVTEQVAGDDWESQFEAEEAEAEDPHTRSEQFALRRVVAADAIQIPTIDEPAQDHLQLDVFVYLDLQSFRFLLIDNILIYEYRDVEYASIVSRLSDEQIEAFWERLEAMGYRDWKPRYEDPGFMDGAYFGIQIVRDSVEINSSGRNNGPFNPDSDNESGLGLINVLQSELYRLIDEAEELYVVPGWTKEPTLG